MTNTFGPEQGLARLIALDQEKWSHLREYQSTLSATGTSGQERLNLLKDWMTAVNAAQNEEVASLLQITRAAGLWVAISHSAETHGRSWTLIPMPPVIEEMWREKEVAERARAEGQMGKK